MKTWPGWAPLPLRLMLGIGFLYHGWPKVFSVEGHQQFVGMLTGIGIPAPGLMAWVVGILEVVSGLAFILGAFVAIFAALMIVDMLVAMFTVHIGAGFSFMNITGMGPEGPTFGMPGYEVNLLYIAALLALALFGAGEASVERARTGRRAEPVAVRP